MKRAFLILGMALIPLSTPAQDHGSAGSTPNTMKLAPGAKSPAATIDDVAWLSGRWEGEFLGGAIDEVWSTPAGGSMMGHFRLVRDGKPVFYEIMTLLEANGSVEMRLKHVNPDMTGWEEKNDFVTFRLVRHAPDALFFDGLTFRRIDENRVDGFIALRDRATGVVREEKLVYRRVK